MVTQKSDKNPLQILREFNQRILFSALDALEGSKAIVWEQALIKPFELVAGFRLLQHHNVTKMLFLDSVNPVSVDHVIYILRAENNPLKSLITALKVNTNKSDRRLHHIFFVPEASTIIREKMKHDDIRSRIEAIKDLPIRLFPLETDLYTMFLNGSVPRLLVNNDWTELFRVSTALYQLHSIFSQPPAIHYKGTWASQVAEMLKKRRAQVLKSTIIGKQLKDGEVRYTGPLAVREIVVVDRWLDPVTPLLSQLTYHGLIDELFSLNAGVVKIPTGEFVGKEESGGATSTAGDLKQITLNDELFEHLQNTHFDAVGLKLSKYVKSLNEQETHGKACTSVTEYKDFVKRLPELQNGKKSAGEHLRLAELIKTFIYGDEFHSTVQCEKEILANEHGDQVIPFVEDAIIRAIAPVKALRLMCLQSVVCDGLKPATFQYYRRLFIQSYGIDEFDWLLKLQMVGLLKDKSNTKIQTTYPMINYSQLLKPMRLIPEEKDDNDISRLYSGYAPLLVRVLVQSERTRWTEWDSRLPGGYGSLPGSGAGGAGSTVLFVIGGISHAEMSAIRLALPRVVLIASTAIITGDRLLESVRNI